MSSTEIYNLDVDNKMISNLKNDNEFKNYNDFSVMYNGSFTTFVVHRSEIFVYDRDYLKLLMNNSNAMKHSSLTLQKQFIYNIKTIMQHFNKRGSINDLLDCFVTVSKNSGSYSRLLNDVLKFELCSPYGVTFIMYKILQNNPDASFKNVVSFVASYINDLSNNNCGVLSYNDVVSISENFSE